MRMKELVFEVKRLKGLTNYGLARDLRKMGVEVTTTGINGYVKGVSRVRIDVLCGLVKMLGRGWEYAGKLIEKGAKMKKLAILAFLFCSMSSLDASAQFPQCSGFSQAQCDLIAQCQATLSDIDPICLALHSNISNRNDLADLVSTLQSLLDDRGDEVESLKKRVKRLRRKVAELSE